MDQNTTQTAPITTAPQVATDALPPMLRPAPIPITTERLILRPPQAGDGAPLCAAVLETWDQLNQWMPWARERKDATNDFYEAYAIENAAKFITRENLAVLAFERSTGDLVASSGLHRIDWDIGQFEIGYWVREEAQGQGYAQEIADALTRYAFDALCANSVLICHSEGNEASRNVITRLGFTHCASVPYANAVPSGAILTNHMYYRTDLAGLKPRQVTWG
jgi:RimJ/RimL family protein N-acetyltransferase